MLIPASTDRAHAKWSDPRCDTVKVLNMAARRIGRRRRAADMNACRLFDGDGNVHWASGPHLNGYDHIWTGKRDRLGREIRRPMTHEELHRPTDEWTVAQFHHWRRGLHGGPRPKTVPERQRQAKRRRVRICWEIKSGDYGEADYAERFVDSCEASGWDAYYMTLVTMPHWRQKLRAFHDAGGQTALLAHGAPRPADLADWRPFIDRIWGRFAPNER